MKRELKIGDSVRVYNDTGMFDGEIVEILAGSQPGIIVEHSDGLKGYRRQVFPQQCRRLVKKPRAPKEAKEPIVRWMVTGGSVGGERFYGCQQLDSKRNPLTQVRLQEIPADAIPLTSQQLASAWVRAYGETCMCDDFRALAKALGFFAEAGGGE